MEIEIVEVLIHKELIGQISKEEQRKLTAWLKEDEQHQQTYEELSAIWEYAQLEEGDMLTVDLDKGLSRLHAGIVEDDLMVKAEPKIVALSKKKNSIPWMKIAAGFIILLGIAMLSRVFAPSGDQQFVEHTEKGEIQTLDMPDGSTILLNEATEMTFFPHIKSERRVSLKGEAFFDVARDESKPFIIETSNATINVLGTSFNVQATDDGKTKVIVRSGKVSVAPKNGQATKILTRGQSIILDDTFEELPEAKEVVLDSYQGLLTFKNTNMTEVFTKLHLRFGKRFVWNSDLLKNCPLTGELDDNSLSEIMAILKTVFEIEEITITEEEVTLIGGQCN